MFDVVITRPNHCTDDWDILVYKTFKDVLHRELWKLGIKIEEKKFYILLMGMCPEVTMRQNPIFFCCFNCSTIGCEIT